jgi:hypothetical protein
LADVFFDMEHDTAAESWGIQSLSGRTDHSTSLRERPRLSLAAKGLPGSDAFTEAVPDSPPAGTPYDPFRASDAALVQ